MAFDFTGKTAIVTGGTQGIGLEIAKGIVAGGGHVALIARNAAKGEAAVAELGEGNKFGSVRPGLTYMCPHGAISLTP